MTTDCETCDGTGYTCTECANADGNCTCEDGPELTSCDDCQGTGLVRVEGDDDGR